MVATAAVMFLPLILAPNFDNDGIRLAVSPICGALSGNVTDTNAGIILEAYTTIVAFGVRYIRSLCLLYELIGSRLVRRTGLVYRRRSAEWLDIGAAHSNTTRFGGWRTLYKRESVD